MQANRKQKLLLLWANGSTVRFHGKVDDMGQQTICMVCNTVSYSSQCIICYNPAQTNINTTTSTKNSSSYALSGLPSEPEPNKCEALNRIGEESEELFSQSLLPRYSTPRLDVENIETLSPLPQNRPISSAIISSQTPSNNSHFELELQQFFLDLPLPNDSPHQSFSTVDVQSEKLFPDTSSNNTPVDVPSDGKSDPNDAVYPLIPTLMRIEREIIANPTASLEYKRSVAHVVGNYASYWERLLEPINDLGKTGVSAPNQLISQSLDVDLRDLSSDYQSELSSSMGNALESSINAQFNQLISQPPDVDFGALVSDEQLGESESEDQVDLVNEEVNFNLPGAQRTVHRICHICGLVMLDSRPFLLTRHLKTHAPRVPCEKCGKLYAERSLLHHSSKCKGIAGEGFSCITCHKSFKSTKTLKAHSKLHN